MAKAENIKEQLTMTVMLKRTLETEEIVELNAIVFLWDEYFEQSEEIAHIDGYIARSIIEAKTIYRELDSIDSDAESVGSIFTQFFYFQSLDLYEPDALLLTSINIEEEYRGNKLTGHLIDLLAKTLQLQYANTVVALDPNPLHMAKEDENYPEIYEKIIAAYEQAGFQKFEKLSGKNAEFLGMVANWADGLNGDWPDALKIFKNSSHS